MTGAGGFIGSHLVERLVELGTRVRALARDNSRNDWGLLDILPYQDSLLAYLVSAATDAAIWPSSA